ncbi:MAG: hypothetical protein JW952_04865 [Candidatus Eisenbacteria bacterium]|nr:hypothetical protein [Candidatus Eisenbacteria bacterium]
MKTNSVVGALVGTLLSVALLTVAAHIGVCEGAGPHDGSEWAAGAGGAGRAPGFWLPDSMETGWRAPDKRLHLLASYAIVLTGEAATDRLDTGVAWAVGLSAAKELWDLWFKTPASRRGASKGDLVADAVGLVAAVVVIQAFGD